MVMTFVNKIKDGLLDCAVILFAAVCMFYYY